MARIEGFRVQNFKALKDVTLGRLYNQKDIAPLGDMTVVIGKNGVGKSTLFDAFGFLADCLIFDVETACDMKQRGGFGRLRSKGSNDPIKFDVYYREAGNERPITYELEIALDSSGRPFISSEVLRQRRKNASHGRPFPFLNLKNGVGSVWAGEDALSDSEVGEENSNSSSVELTDLRQLGIATLGTLKEHPRIKKFRDFLKGWYLSYFTPDAARSLPTAGPQKHLNIHGDNLGNVVQFMEREHKDKFQSILNRIANKIPSITSISTEETTDKRLLLKFDDGSAQDPFYAQQMSDGTLKVFAYLLMLEDPSPPPFICIEEPENGLYHKLLNTLVQEFREHAQNKKGSQVFVTTHQPYLVDGLAPEEVWILEKQLDGFSKITRVSDIPNVKELYEQELPLGALWYSDYLEG
ncbi:hypothetical protein DTO96_100638 [Ephemeroptericola cinctiostellae]|uniref:ATPase AAA-type core domain-containing protein n=1 Tax=Ephemeroptericola cinctiostellae TaxID=2268024 RepID=A0A345D984_9BURK|nr:AAA family ATPase [Ephemeroptericola cinctiostellae]AXF84922.1 hypothetical protein DTO96_100638 [Ephemeroptericola cinctiostellae]